jgi:L-ornithine N5-oxygenase
MTQYIFDVIGIGFGPANIALAAAFEERNACLSVLFLEKAGGPTWQPAMLLNGSDIQNNPLRDLVTPRNPRSRYSFTNFLHEHGRLFEYLNLGVEYPLRKEYAQYVTWVAHHFDDQVRYQSEVRDISVTTIDGSVIFTLITDNEEKFLCRSVVAAPGRTPLIPEPFRGKEGDRLFHLTNYMPMLERLNLRNGKMKRACVVGGSQSAVEIILDLSARFPDMEIVNIQRGFGFFLKDTSPFSDRVYFPEHVDYYFDASPESKVTIDTQLKRTNYSSADGDVIHRLYLTLYEQKLDQAEKIRILTNTKANAIKMDDRGVTLSLEEVHRRQHSEVEVDFVVLATGFCNLGRAENHELFPPLLSSIADHLAKSPEGVLKVCRDYRLLPAAPMIALPPIYINGLCETTHGMGDAGSFSLLSLRADLIARSLGTALSEGT